MRQANLDRSHGDRRFGLRRAALAAWAVVFVLFGAILAVSSLVGPTAGRSASPDRVIASLVVRAVPPERDACQCTEFDHLQMTAAPSLC